MNYLYSNLQIFVQNFIGYLFLTSDPGNNPPYRIQLEPTSFLLASCLPSKIYTLIWIRWKINIKLVRALPIHEINWRDSTLILKRLTA